MTCEEMTVVRLGFAGIIQLFAAAVGGGLAAWCIIREWVQREFNEIKKLVKEINQ